MAGAEIIIQHASFSSDCSQTSQLLGSTVIEPIRYIQEFQYFTNLNVILSLTLTLEQWERAWALAQAFQGNFRCLAELQKGPSCSLCQPKLGF